MSSFLRRLGSGLVYGLTVISFAFSSPFMLCVSKSRCVPKFVYRLECTALWFNKSFRSKKKKVLLYESRPPASGSGDGCKGKAIKDLAPTLRDMTVASALHNGTWITQITRGLTVPGMAEYLSIWDQVRHVQLSEAEDCLIWR